MIGVINGMYREHEKVEECEKDKLRDLKCPKVPSELCSLQQPLCRLHWRRHTQFCHEQVRVATRSDGKYVVREWLPFTTKMLN